MTLFRDHKNSHLNFQRFQIIKYLKACIIPGFYRPQFKHGKYISDLFLQPETCLRYCLKTAHKTKLQKSKINNNFGFVKKTNHKNQVKFSNSKLLLVQKLGIQQKSKNYKYLSELMTIDKYRFLFPRGRSVAETGVKLHGFRAFSFTNLNRDLGQNRIF